MHLALLLLLPGWAAADLLDDDAGGYRTEGPTMSQIELRKVQEASPYESEGPLSITVQNHSEYYLDRVAIECTITDRRGFRVFEDIVFKSGPLFTIGLYLPPIRRPAMGIPPGAVADIELYTDDTRWSRGQGAYQYECQLYGVGGSS
jgi:hypothetical protein